MQPTQGLVLDLWRQVRELLRAEFLLAKAELSERGQLASSSLIAVVIGLVLLPIGVIFLFVALGLVLMRFGVPLDLSFLIVAVIAILGGVLALRTGAKGLKPSRLAPTKTISQISSLLGDH